MRTKQQNLKISKEPKKFHIECVCVAFWFHWKYQKKNHQEFQWLIDTHTHTHKGSNQWRKMRFPFFISKIDFKLLFDSWRFSESFLKIKLNHHHHHYHSIYCPYNYYCFDFNVFSFILSKFLSNFRWWWLCIWIIDSGLLFKRTTTTQNFLFLDCYHHHRSDKHFKFSIWSSNKRMKKNHQYRIEILGICTKEFFSNFKNSGLLENRLSSLLSVFSLPSFSKKKMHYPFIIEMAREIFSFSIPIHSFILWVSKFIFLLFIFLFSSIQFNDVLSSSFAVWMKWNEWFGQQPYDGSLYAHSSFIQWLFHFFSYYFPIYTWIEKSFLRHSTTKKERILPLSQ